MKRVITSLLAILFVLPMVFPLAACTTETGGENMANYLYNGVELPDINEVWADKETYPYAVIYSNLDGGVLDSSLSGQKVWSLLLTSVQGYYNGGYKIDSAHKAQAFMLAETQELADKFETIANITIPSGAWGDMGTHEEAGAMSYDEGATFLWSNHDILNEDGSVYLAASTPVPVGGSKLTISTGGSANGDGMALYNGVMLPKLPSDYPYSFLEAMGDDNTGTLWILWACSDRPYAESGGDIVFSVSAEVELYALATTEEAKATLPYFPINSVGEWNYVGTESMDAVSFFSGSYYWSSFDVLLSDGVVYSEGSDPIPLDGMSVITWDGDTTGLTSVADYPFYKVTNDVPDEEVLENGFVYVVGGGLIDLSDSVETNGDIVMLGIDAAIIAKTDGAVLGDIPFPEKGIYFPATDGIYTSALAYPASSGGVTETTATVNFSCTDLLYTDSVYRIKAWVYEPGAGGSGTMLYNGVELPELPEWDKDTYPYAFIEIQKDFIYLHCLKTKFHYCYSEHYACYAMLPYYGDSFAYFYFYRELDSETGTWTDGWKTGSAVDYGTGSYGFPERWSEKLCVWANYDVLNCYHVAEDPECDCPIYLAASDPVPAGGPDVTQPPTFTSELFAGPSHTETFTVSGLTPATDYGVYGVIWLETDNAASEHNATATFTTLEGEAPTGTIQFGAVNITGTGFTAVIEASGLDDATAYTAEIVVYNTATSAVAAEAVRSFTGNYTMAIDFAGLTPETDYTVAVDVYPTDTGKVVARGEFPVTTGQEEPKTSWRDSFLLGFASGLGCTAATKTDADHNAWMQGYLVGDALRSAITTQQGFRYEVPDLQATVRMVAECFTESGDTLLFNAHNGSMILGVSTQNEATFTDRTDVTKYLIPIPAEASKVTVETSDPKVTLAQFIGVNGSNGSYTKVFSSAREAVYSYEFPKGAAQYMAIDLIYEDKGAVTVPWDYDATATTTVTFT